MLAMKRDTFSCCIEEMCFVQRNMYFYRKICTFTEKSLGKCILLRCLSKFYPVYDGIPRDSSVTN